MEREVDRNVPPSIVITGHQENFAQFRTEDTAIFSSTDHCLLPEPTTHRPPHVEREAPKETTRERFEITIYKRRLLSARVVRSG